MSSKYLRLVFSSALCNTPIEMQICEVMVFISGGAPTLLGIYPEMTAIPCASLGLPIYAAESWVTETYSIRSVNYFSFASWVALLLPWVRSISSKQGLISMEMGSSVGVL